MPETRRAARVTRLLIIDGANVVGSRPDGWWRDRPGAARRLHDQLRQLGDLGFDELILVLEGRARAGVPAGRQGSVETVHADADGDARMVELTRASAGRDVTVLTADRGLADRVCALGAAVRGPGWLLGQLP